MKLVVDNSVEALEFFGILKKYGYRVTCNGRELRVSKRKETTQIETYGNITYIKLREEANNEDHKH